MKPLDPNIMFFGNYIDADVRFADLQEFIERIDKYLILKSNMLARKPKKQKLLFDLDMEQYLYAESFPDILYKTALISVWNFMEQEFKGYCQEMKRVLNIKIDITDLSGSYIERFKKYTEKVLGLNIPTSAQDWEDLRAISEIRNALVHADGDIPENKIKLISTFCKKHNLLLNEGNRVIVDKFSAVIIIVLCKRIIEMIYMVALEKFPGEYGRRK